MLKWLAPGRRLPVTVALLVAVIVVGIIIGHTHGATPTPGATYTGTVYVETPAGKITQRLPMSFAIDNSGQRVTRFHFPSGLPRGCGDRTLANVAARSAPTPIRNPSHFEVNLAVTGDASRVGTLEISGSFHSQNRESGAIATQYSAPNLRGCDANGGYSTKADS